VRETVLFSARLRLERSDPAVTPESTIAFVNQTLRMLELTDIEDLQVNPILLTPCGAAMGEIKLLTFLLSE
jgi:hypothetical protein